MAFMTEIERRFLCRIMNHRALRDAGGERIRQAYLPGTNGPSVRIRERAGRYVLAIKAGEGRVRREVEVEVDRERADALFEMAGELCITKSRHELGRWEVDIFEGRFDGLVVAEVELEHEDEPLPDPPDGIELLEEVTDELTSHDLAALDAGAARTLVARATSR